MLEVCSFQIFSQYFIIYLSIYLCVCVCARARVCVCVSAWAREREVWQKGICLQAAQARVSSTQKKKKEKKKRALAALKKKKKKKKKKCSKERYLLGRKHNLQIFRVIPFVKLQNDT